MGEGLLAPPVRLFLDSGVIIEGCFSAWGASKATLVLATITSNYTIVLAEAVEQEMRDAVARKAAGLDEAAARDLALGSTGWLRRVRVERHAKPSEAETRERMETILPALRHLNDLPIVVTAIQARPDWVLSTNTEHWNEALATRTGLRIATPLGFQRSLRPIEAG